MSEEKKNYFTIKNDKGESLECEVILTIDSAEFGKNYIVYTDHSLNENGLINTYASIYDPSGKDLSLRPVETEEEWDMIENVLSSAQKKAIKEEREGQED